MVVQHQYYLKYSQCSGHNTSASQFLLKKTLLTLKNTVTQEDVLSNRLQMASPSIKPTAEHFKRHYYNGICVMLT